MKTKQIQNADVVCDETGRQYHIGLAPGELSEYVLLTGSAERAFMASEMLTDIRIENRNREYQTFTGKYNGFEVSVMSTGMGPGCTEIGVIEIFQITKNPTLIRIGTSGGLQEQMGLGDLVISTGAVRLEDTSTYFVCEGYPAVAHYEVVTALIEACDKIKVPYHVGLTATASGFYGAQGRKIPGIYIRNPGLADELAQMNVKNFEMEASTLFTLCTMKEVRAGAICVAVNNRSKGTFVDPETYKKREKDALIAGFDALIKLHK
ncbi:MAG: nucleoside phosphorylase [Gammaproteobacteria bacterium]|nr:nucleoside phosphorylase [Gammaproteobacteria bacterium]